MKHEIAFWASLVICNIYNASEQKNHRIMSLLWLILAVIICLI